MIYLDVDDLLYIVSRVVTPVEVCDIGLLEAAASRPPAEYASVEVYPTIHEKAAALLQSVTGNHALIDGNERLGLAALIAFYGLNGYRLTASNSAAHKLVMAVASGKLTDVAAISRKLQAIAEK